MSLSILIVEDQFIEANNLKLILRRAGYTVWPIAHSVADARLIMEKNQPDMVLLDIRLQGSLTGIDLARDLREKNIAFVYLSANSDRRVLDEAIATQPYGFMEKPFREKDVLVTIDIAIYLHQHKRELAKSQHIPADSKDIDEKTFRGIIGESKKFQDLLHHVRIVGYSDTSVLILGESGTGKELIARALHRLSARHSSPLIVVNCGVLPEHLIESELFGHEKGTFTGATEKRIGKFEQADGGTIFLDEIGELSTDMQVKFLRVLQEKEVEPIGGSIKTINIRVIAATNRNLQEEVTSGRFRLDLYYRLNVFPITLPPLRERREDILLLAQHFIEQYARKMNKTVTGVTDRLAGELLAYNWPGNVRELENLMERCVLLAPRPVIESGFLPLKNQPIFQSMERLKTITENEHDHILEALQRCGWKIHGEGGAAQMLDINPSTLISRMKKLNIQKKGDFR
jgi:two-component system, NtrC family, response regulator HydG